MFGVGAFVFADMPAPDEFVFISFDAGMFVDSAPVFGWLLHPAKKMGTASNGMSFFMFFILLILLLRFERDVVDDILDALNSLGDVFGLGFLVIGIHKAAQLRGAAEDIHVHPAEFVFRIIVQRVFNAGFGCRIVNVLAGAAIILAARRNRWLP